MKTVVTVLGLMMLTYCGWSAAQDLPPDILADLYLLEAAKAMEKGDAQAALRALEKIEALDVEPPLEFLYAYGRVLVENGTTLEDVRKGESLLKQYVLGVDRTSEQYGSALELLAMARGRLEAMGEQLGTGQGVPSDSKPEEMGAQLGRGEGVPERAKLIEHRVFLEDKLLDTYVEYNWETVDSNGVTRFFSKSVEGQEIEEIIVDGKEHEIADGKMEMTEAKYRATFDGEKYRLRFKGLLDGAPVEITHSKLGNLCQQEKTPVKIKLEFRKGEFQEYKATFRCRVLE